MRDDIVGADVGADTAGSLRRVEQCGQDLTESQHGRREHRARPVRVGGHDVAYLPAPVGLLDGVHRHVFPPNEPVQIITLEDMAEFATLAFEQPDRFAGRTLELAGDDPTPAEAIAAISAATGIAVRYEQLTHDETAALKPEIAEPWQRWISGQRRHADIEALRVVHPGPRTLTDWLSEGGAAALRTRLLGTPQQQAAPGHSG